jgi:hypothetical protein
MMDHRPWNYAGSPNLVALRLGLSALPVWMYTALLSGLSLGRQTSGTAEKP